MSRLCSVFSIKEQGLGHVEKIIRYPTGTSTYPFD